jgi:two-component system nitrate/nitrite response regulator NarL
VSAQTIREHRVNSTELGAPRTLVVDGHRLFAESVAAGLAGRGHQIVGVACTGAEAVEIAREAEPDLVIIDLELPGLSGLAAGRTVLLHNPMVRVVAMAGSADRAAIAATFEAGFHGLVTKTSSMTQLVDVLRAVGAGSRVIPEIGGWEENLGEAQSGRVSEPLTNREWEVLRLLGQGVATREIARRLHIAPHTVRSHVQRVMSKLGVHSRLEAVALARRTGLLTGHAAAPATAGLRSEP